MTVVNIKPIIMMEKSAWSKSFIEILKKKETGRMFRSIFNSHLVENKFNTRKHYITLLNLALENDLVSFDIGIKY